MGDSTAKRWQGAAPRTEQERGDDVLRRLHHQVHWAAAPRAQEAAAQHAHLRVPTIVVRLYSRTIKFKTVTKDRIAFPSPCHPIFAFKFPSRKSS